MREVTDAEVEVGAVSLPAGRGDQNRGCAESLECAGVDALGCIEDDDGVLRAQLGQRGETSRDEIDPGVGDQDGAGALAGTRWVQRQPVRCQ
jgi:hypothetical protein